MEPSANMGKIAEKRGVTVYNAYAENLPIDNSSFDFALMVTTVCFLSDLRKAFSEVHRILQPAGEIILAIIDKNSKLGRKYKKEKASNKFYKNAHFYSTEELTALLHHSGFQNFQYWQTLSKLKAKEIEKPKKGYGQGSFIVIKANKV